ncbi:Phytosulfokine receptor 2 [Spatholobus suberectus]|nr:Phytosulfokine receptor 2 [Spatholobus suberectus]
MGLSNLQTLDLATDHFTGHLPTSLSYCRELKQGKNLTTPTLTKNFHGEEIPESVTVGLGSLMILALGNCGLKSYIPSWLLNRRKLEVLDLAWNHLNGILPSLIGQIENLLYLDFSHDLCK